jgi:acetyl esterase/lipase
MTSPTVRTETGEVTLRADLEYAVVDGVSLKLDLYLPAEPVAALPSVLYLHGGAWAVGDKASHAAERLVPLAAYGFAVASANYRLTGQATFPAQLHDVKAAVRWLRGAAEDHGLDPGRVGAIGASAGGHLASLLGVTAGDGDLEGTVGEHLDQPSDVGAVVAYFPPGDLVLSGSRSPLEQEIVPRSPAAELLGVASTAQDPEAARRASPRWRASARSAPHLILHGDRDSMVPEVQSRLLHDALSGHGARSTFVVLGGAGHEDPAFDQPWVIGAIAGFLHGHLG